MLKSPFVTLETDPVINFDVPLHQADAAAIPVLEALLNDPDENTRRIALHGLEKVGPAAQEAIPALEKYGESLRNADGSIPYWETLELLEALNRIDPNHPKQMPLDFHWMGVF